MSYKSTLLLVFLALLISACSLDNYQGPTQTLKGKVINKNTNKPLNTEFGDHGIRIRLDELSWSDNPQPYYFNAKMDGTFQNTKIFEGEYRISVEGPFVPLLQRDDQGNVIVDKRKKMDIKGGVTNVSFEVTPLLDVQWVGEPVVNSDNTVTVKVKVTRSTDDSEFQRPLTDVDLYINRYRNASNNNYSPILSKQVHYNGTEGNDKLGKTITITSKSPLTSDGIKEWYVRVGARTNYGQQRFNYTDPMMVKVGE